MYIPSKFINWHAVIFEAVIVFTYMIHIWFVTSENPTLQFVPVVRSVESVIELSENNLVS